MAAILDSAIFHKNKLHSFILTQLDDGSDIEFCHFGFSHFAQKKTFTHSFWLNLMMAAILNSASILNSAILDSAILHKKLQLVHSDSIWWWQPSWILPCWIQTLPSWIQTLCYLLSDLLKNTLSPLWLWFKLMLNSAIMDSAIFLKTLSPTNSIWLKVIHSDSTWWWQPSWIQPFFTKINFTHSVWLNLMVAAILNSDIMDSAIFLKTLTQTNSFWLKLIHSHLTWWWQPSWTLPGWIQILPSWIQHLVIFSQIHSKTLSLHSDSDSN